MKKMNFLPALGIVIFIYLVFQIGLLGVISNLMKANILYLAIAFCIYCPIFLIKIFKWSYLISVHGKKHSFSVIAQLFLASYFLSLVTPGKIGDLARSIYLKKDLKMPLGKSLSTVILDRIFDISIIISFAFSGMLLFINYFGFVYSFNVFIIFGVLFLAFFYVILNKKYAKFISKRILLSFISKKYKEKYNFSSLFNEFYDSSELIIRNKRMLITSIALTAITIILGIIQIKIITLALNLDISLMFLLLAIPILYLSEMIPLSIAGMGTRDAVAILLFSLISIPSGIAFSISITMLIFNYIFGFFCMIFWLKKPISI
jgi:uncharacterized protein (TIRG00374 family)